MAKRGFCSHGINQKYCPRCKFPPVTQCRVCGELTQTLIHVLHGNLHSMGNDDGWPLCSNECADKLKMWLGLQTQRDEGETSGTVSSSADAKSGRMRQMSCVDVRPSLEKE